MNYHTLLKSKINDLLDVSPSDSDASSRIIETKDGYLGVLRVISSQGKFIVKATEKDLDGIIGSLFKLMYERLKVWRSSRFKTDHNAYTTEV